MLTKGYTMRIPLIYIRDKSSGHERLVGTNCHDQLIIDEKTKAIRYHNLQNSCGTPYTYEFVGMEEETYYGKEVYVKMVSWKEAAQLFKTQDADMAEADKLLEDMARWFLHEKGE